MIKKIQIHLFYVILYNVAKPLRNHLILLSLFFLFQLFIIQSDKPADGCEMWEVVWWLCGCGSLNVKSTENWEALSLLLQHKTFQKREKVISATQVLPDIFMF